LDAVVAIAAAPAFSVIDMILGSAVFLSFVAFAIGLSSLRRCVVEEKLRPQENLSGIMAAPIPPERVLTDAGLRRIKIAKNALAVCMVCVAVIVVRRNFL
jgi:hypothetical protein